MEAIEAVMEVNRIFKSKNWIEKDTNELAFNGFCQLFTKLEPEERKLIIELTNNYHWISYSEYQNKIIQAMQALSVDELGDITTIYFFPIIKLTDKDKIKSGEHLLYIIKAFKHLMTNYRDIHFKYLKTFEHIEKLRLNRNERIFLVDDYVGSGKTFDFCMAELKKNTSILSASVKVVCIAIQEETQINLVMDGYAVLKALVIKRGITDYNTQPTIDQKKNLMKKVEKHIPGAKSFSMGYNETEALITMMRTPDNTFPVFWKKFRKDGQHFDAPFARYEENE